LTIDLSKDLEKIVQDTVRAGLYPCEADVIRDAPIRLDQSLSRTARASGKKTKRAKPAPQEKPIIEEEFLKHLVEIGLMTQLPDTAADHDDPDDQLIDIKGEPISETIIRERR
jgi:Arc/MetJ-type ribon-helix-helix transcriptional regulator